MKTLVLASASRYRAELLSRLKVPFQAVAPRVDESALQGETAPDTASRLAEAKARAVAGQFRNALVIGSDQVADLGGEPIGKPGNRERAVAQLRQASGRQIVFHTALSLLNTESGRIRSCTVPTTVTLRILSDAEIEAYTQIEPAFDCAGGARFEGLGISLIASLECSDPNALIGLPMIALVDMLRAENFSVLT